MSISKNILLDELIEQPHHEKVEDVIFWALEMYAENNKGTNGAMVAYAITQRIEDDEKEGKSKLMNPELIKSLGL
ncbi:hypothetical protein M1M25_gp025 [Tenacibaculum phage Gundel_1]|uniref:Uncharacterized protein n=1 Tax=Tenacibaculum phage Gundel_1 TaxID=2745672 RepID=A0A8E4ZL23_9CAUD|nr:hypothetical protein M1M25_gp025 [Tenacibaculum phage Gundel_1]QQV91456.1 hypothetical protein Gundel1_25 [Tenacibaculum phage Gundel_1]